MSRTAAAFSLSRDQREILINYSDTLPITDPICLKSRVLLELDKGTLIKTIARSLYLRPNRIISIREAYRSKGIDSFNEGKKVYVKIPIDNKLKEVVSEMRQNGEKINKSILCKKLNCSVSKIRRACKRNNIILDNENENENELKTLSIIPINAESIIFKGLYSGEEGSLVIFAIHKSIALSSIVNQLFSFKSEDDNQKGVLYLWKDLANLRGNNYFAKGIISKDKFENEILNNISDEYELVAISYGNIISDDKIFSKIYIHNEIENWYHQILFFIKNIANGDIEIVKNILSEIKTIISKSKEKEEFFWVSTRNGAQNILNDQVLAIDKTVSKLTIKYSYVENSTEISGEYVLNINKGIIESLKNTKDIREYLNALGTLELTLREATNKASGEFMVNVLGDSMKPDNKLRHIKIETIFGRKDILINNELVKNIGPNEYLYTPDLLEILTTSIVEAPYEQTVNRLNDLFLRKNDPLNYRTVYNLAQKNGEVRTAITDLALKTLKDKDYNPETGTPKQNKDLTNYNYEQTNANFVANTEMLVPYMLSALRDKNLYNKGIKYILKHNVKCPDLTINSNAMLLCENDTNNSLYIIIDDVLVHHQCEQRAVNGKDQIKSSTFVSHTNVYIKCSEGDYYITADDTNIACRIVQAFLLKNKLAKKQLVFFFDGAREIIKNIEYIFKNTNLPSIYILDWYHIVKKINEYLSMALKGGKENIEANKDFKRILMKQLWYGRVDLALKTLHELNKSKIKDEKYIKSIIKYLSSREKYIPCYALRKKMGLLNSSNRVEAANFKIVAKRQKKHGYSWGYNGSHKLASLTALQANGELKDWLKHETLRFGFNNKNDEKNNISCNSTVISAAA